MSKFIELDVVLPTGAKKWVFNTDYIIAVNAAEDKPKHSRIFVANLPAALEFTGVYLVRNEYSRVLALLK